MKIALNNTFITDNSKDVESGCYFVVSNSNSKYADDALDSGANLISPKQAMELLRLKNCIKIIGITGTNGKTTTAFLLAHTLSNLGHKSAVSGTCGSFVDGKQIAKKGLTTSQILETISYIKQAVESGCEYFIMEISSHAIAQNRIEGLEFELKIFTNLSQDHLDYHKSFSEYASVKSSFLLDECNKIINGDDKNISYNNTNSLTYSLFSGDIYASSFELKSGINATIKNSTEEANLSLDLHGKFNLYNALGVIGATKKLLNLDLQSICDGLKGFKGVAGRMEIVSHKPAIIVDFAHTPDGIEKVLSSLEGSELIVVFGAGGDRDKSKRPIMGQIVSKYAKVAIVTSDNPRSENPNDIIEEVASLMPKNTIKITDRKEAITKAMAMQNGEILLILGKGDEDYQEINGVKYPFSDQEVVKEILNKKDK
ncbi:MAG: UDP-N-acetylmuramoyl-L-alanyl-D-glutamate--2,6-diaminopimelate ligase [Campylobacter sp.]|uniref:UDP-N-acetylmuramoyl-L-alanyl-D-glutamate--2, 6-diaminopimelate ligase n=1 Tax=Campylobacter sp. TaxID=205 RepID=UPI001B026546|nr:UDP-N-acetylmuramoyl-L-alanyl-D-glutamate--2,6-diaminopimelate ligase [Campylobacter sp.]MBO5063402.1 UDP-N-acetylmuramoyl-L-alanyl-D-glutamate--2,6-diaminopimelate ligase [Campylobacter sp.]